MDNKIKRQYQASKELFKHYSRYEDEKTIQAKYNYLKGMIYAWFIAELITWEEYQKLYHELNIIKNPLKVGVE